MNLRGKEFRIQNPAISGAILEEPEVPQPEPTPIDMSRLQRPSKSYRQGDGSNLKGPFNAG